MKIKKVRKELEQLKSAILKDGKVDKEEAIVLLDFIKPYAKLGIDEFISLKEILENSLKDGVITHQESSGIVENLQTVSNYLKVQQIIEIVFVGLLGLALVGYIAYVICLKLL